MENVVKIGNKVLISDIITGKKTIKTVTCIVKKEGYGLGFDCEYDITHFSSLTDSIKFMTTGLSTPIHPNEMYIELVVEGERAPK